MIVSQPTLPLFVMCETCRQSWVQINPWEPGTLLTHECGGLAVIHEYITWEKKGVNE